MTILRENVVVVAIVVVFCCVVEKARRTRFMLLPRHFTLAFFFIQFLSFGKMKVQGQTKWSLGLTRKKLAGWAPGGD